MATRKVRKITEKKTVILSRSLILGLISVAAIIVLILQILPIVRREGKTNMPKPNPPNPTQKKVQVENTYKIQAGDSLWSIAEKQYGSGFKAYEIAKANNISDPDSIEVGQMLTIPTVTSVSASASIEEEVQPGEKGGEITAMAASTERVSQNQPITYTVQKGDYLWNIAEMMYGDGYQWVQIARANNLAEPDIIHTGNILIIPR